MRVIQSLFISILLANAQSFHLIPQDPQLSPVNVSSKSLPHRLSKPLIGGDGRIYTCSDMNLFAFENNGSIAWSLHLNYKCSVHMAPVQGSPGEMYVIAENRVLRILYNKNEAPEPTSQVFFGPGPGQKSSVEIVGIAVSILCSTVYINVKNRGLFAYMKHGHLLWSAGPVLDRFGYRLGCKKNVTDCYFTSVPVLDQCEANIYISNSEGELYCLSVHSPHFKWIQDLSYLDKVFTVTPGNNGRLYVTVPVKALVLALDVFSGNVLWQRSIGPFSKQACAAVVDSNGWISIGSLDGFLYTSSPTGAVKKFSRRNTKDYVIQVDPILDCSGYGIYISQAEMEGKTNHIIGDYTYISTMQPKTVVFTLLVPATGSIYWSETYPGPFSSLLSNSDLGQFVVDEEILLAFVAASNTGSPLQCRATGEKLASTCSQARTNIGRFYTGNERAIMLFLVFESAVLMMLAIMVRFCCSFWAKKKLQSQGLGSFLDKRRLLRSKKKAFNKTISKLEQKAAEEAVSNEVLEQLGDMIRERECIERKLSSSYSFRRDKARTRSKSLLPLNDGKIRSYSFRSAKKAESVPVCHALSVTSSRESCGETEIGFVEGKGKGVLVEEEEEDSWASEDGSCGRGYFTSPSEPVSSSKGVYCGNEVEKLPN